MTHGTLTVELLDEQYNSIQNVVERELKVYLTATVSRTLCGVCILVPHAHVNTRTNMHQPK